LNLDEEIKSFYKIDENKAFQLLVDHFGEKVFNNCALENLAISIFPNPASDLIAIQVDGLLKDDLKVELIDLSGKIVKETMMHKGSTIAFFDVSTVYNGAYIITISNANGIRSSKVKIK